MYCVIESQAKCMHLGPGITALLPFIGADWYPPAFDLAELCI